MSGRRDRGSRRSKPNRPVGARGTRAPAGRALALIAVLLTASVATVVVASLARREATERVALPPPVERRPTPTVTTTDFAGAEACASCHSEQFAAWEESTHGRAGGAARASVVIAPFDGRPIRFRDAVVLPAVVGSRYLFIVRQDGRPERRITVDGVVGGGHMVGGGTQGFLTRHDDGTLRFLPFDWSRHERAWFCNTGSRIEKGWLPITPAMALADCGDWPPVRIMGDEPRFANCQGCHGSQVQVAFDTMERRYDTRLTTLAINCESCHGPGREHIARMRSPRASATAAIGMHALATLDESASLALCYQCHAVKDRLADGYLPGEPLEQYYSFRLAQLGDRPFFPDGRVRTFAYQEGHEYSDCFRSGTMRCTDCHDPHSQGYRDVNGLALPDRFSDGQCTSCHASKTEPIERHTFHPASSPGSRCVSCHMPYLQHPELGDAIPYARADHSIPIPRPAFDSALGIASACARCHGERSAASLQAQVTDWYGELKPHTRIVDEQLRASELQGTEAARALLEPDESHAAARFAGVSRLLEEHLRPDMPSLDRLIESRLRTLAADADLDTRALALASLHLARGEDRDVRALLAEALRRAAPADAGLRTRWALALGYAGDRYAESGGLPDAIRAFRKALEITPDDPRVLLSLANAERGAGDLGAAIGHYRRSLAVARADDAPHRALALVNLGIALRAWGDTAEAITAYEEAIRINPHEPLAHYNLGNVHLLRGDATAAAQHYERVLELDAGLAPAHFNLARAYIGRGDYRAALRAVRDGLAFAPDDPAGLHMLAELERAVRPSGRAATGTR